MTNNYHTPPVDGSPANMSVIRAPLEELDQAITDLALTEKDGHIIQNEGTDVAQQQRLNFVGAGVTVTNDAGNSRTVVTIPSSGVTDHGALTGLTDDDHPQYMRNGPGGFLENCVITQSVESNNLTVALKTFAGTDPSASDSIKIVIDGVKRTLESALSITLAAATNWFAMGSAEIATQEVDLFLYMGRRAADGSIFEVISRFPTARLYSDFNATSTNARYGAYSGSAPASTDRVVLIGRFTAILSAGAGYTWSIPATAVIEYGTKKTRWLTWAPVHSRAGTNYTNLPTVNYAYYQIDGEIYRILERHTMHATPGGTGAPRQTLPFPTDGNIQGGPFAWDLSNIITLNAYTQSSTVLELYKYDGTVDVTASRSYEVTLTIKH